MDAFHLHSRRRRAQGATGTIVVVLGALVLSFFQTQVVQNPAYAMQSDRNRMRALPVPAPRGTILDRNGRIMADNVPAYTVSLLPAPADSIRSTLERLAPYLRLTERHTEALVSWHRRHPQHPVVVSTDVPFDQVSALEERRRLFPEVLIEMRPKRNYAAGAAAAHLIGYVGEISEGELLLPEFQGYRPGRVIGKTGVERQYERLLAGSSGVRYLEVDALGRIVGPFATERAVSPREGETLRLSVDMELQRWISRLIPDTIRGAVAALEPWTGAVLALYSSPPIDPNEFVSQISQERWAALRTDPARRLLDRSTSGLYSPASTWKLATAAIALELGVVEPSETMPLACRGGMPYGNRYFRCWQASGHGSQDLTGAIRHSCNVYFYQVGLKIGLERLLAEGIRLGFSQPTGVDLPAERTGHFPPDDAWYERQFGWLPTEAEALSLAIGQGANDQTVLKMAHFYAAIATDGRVPAPRVLADESDGEGEEASGLELRLSERSLEALRQGLRGVIHEGGTAYGSALEHWDWSGKTGTGQNPHGRDHAWFVGIGGERGGEAGIVVAVLIEEGERGSDAAQIAAKTADYYLRRQNGMAIDTIQTLREHWQAGRYAPWAARWR